MDKEEQRIAIAAANRELWADKGYRWTNTGFLYRVEDGHMLTLDPLDDLNVMAEAKKGLNTNERRNDYLAYLWDLLGLERDRVFWDENNAQGLQTIVIDVTAEQQAVAYLKALDLWSSEELPN
ncbi:MAG: hypothetical protein ACSHYB_07085 [Roseibacillus sp.]